MNIDELLSKCNYNLYYDPIQGRLFHVEEIQIVRLGDDGKVRSCRRMVNGISYLCTHIIHFLMTGRLPAKGMLIDHKNNDPWNNKWENLREATYTQNAHNRKHVGNMHGLEPGVSITPGGKYRVRLSRLHVGVFDSAEEANVASITHRRELYGEFDYNHNRDLPCP